MFLRLTSRGNILYSMSSSLNILIMAWTTSSLLFHLSPMFWWFIRCDSHTDTFNLFMSSTSLKTTVGLGCQCSFLFSINLKKKKLETGRNSEQYSSSGFSFGSGGFQCFCMLTLDLGNNKIVCMMFLFCVGSPHVF